MLAVVVTTAVALTIWATIETKKNRLVWDHFDEVTPGVLYRSGQLTKTQIRQAVAKYGIRTIINFQTPGAGVNAERSLAKDLGVDFENLPMPGSGFGKEAQFREVLSVCDDPARRPVLIHCARGTCRTGTAVALYRLERDGWTVDDVAVELKRQGYPQGWIAGYALQMVKKRPFEELYTPLQVIDRNLPEESREPSHDR
jgi:protein tyrosine/serine phosphatase